MKTSLLLPTVFCLATASLWADDKSLGLPGKLIYENAFVSPPDAKWRAAKGQWESLDGALRGTEKPDDKHAAVTRIPIKLKDFIIEFECKLEGGKQCALSINDAKEHVARIIVTPTSVTVKRDDHDHDGPDKAVIFATLPAEFKSGTWHKVRMEMVGDTLLGQVDDLSASGTSALFSTEKASIGLVVAGKSVDFRNLKIWEATKNPDFKAPPVAPKSKGIPKKAP